MLPHSHFVFGFLFAGILLAIMPSIGLIGFILIVLASVLVDIDHYLYYVIILRDLSLREAYEQDIKNGKKLRSLPKSKRKEYHMAWCFLHGLEPLAILLILTLTISEYFGFIFIGFAFHLILDYTTQWQPGLRKDKISVVHDFLKFRKLKYINGN